MKTMKLKKMLAILFALCFSLAACSKNSIDNGREIALGDEASIGNIGYVTLQDAIKAVTDDNTITLLADITLEDTIYIGTDISFTLDLNGKTLDGGSNMAIQHDGTGILNIADSSGGGVSIGKVKSAGGEDVATVGIGNGGHLVLSDCAMITTDGGIGIFNVGSGSVFIAGGDVNATTGGTAIKNGEGEVIVAGGAVGATDSGYAIWNEDNGSINVDGGSVYTEGRYSTAIYNFGIGSVNVSGGTVSCDGSDSHAILNNDTGTVTINGGTIRNNYDMGTAICNEYGGTVSIFNEPLPIQENCEPLVIIGGGMAIDAAPDLGDGVQVAASFDVSGTPRVDYNPKNITKYKYLKFEQGSTSVLTSDGTKKNADDEDVSSNLANSGESNILEVSETSDMKVYEITPESPGPYDPGYTVRFVIVTGNAVTKVEYGHFLQDSVVTLTTPSQTKHNLNYWYVDIVMPEVGDEQRTVTFYAKGYDGSNELEMVFTDVLVNAGELDG